MITIHVNPARRWFSKRGQWTYTIDTGNHEDVDPRDTYFNTGDIRSVMADLTNPNGPSVQLVIHYRDGHQTVETLRPENRWQEDRDAGAIG